MDTYVIQLFEVLVGDAGAQGRNDCQSCIPNPELCHFGTQQCLCGGPVDATPDQLQTMLHGARMGGLDEGDLYCMRVIALQRGGLGAPTAHACECKPEWTMPVMLASSAHLCAQSKKGETGPMGFTMDVRCGSDHGNDRFNTTSQLDDCLRSAP
jgi:hypothetical protein